MATRVKLFAAMMATSLAVGTAAQLPNANDELVTRAFKLDVTNLGTSLVLLHDNSTKVSTIKIDAHTNFQTQVRQFLAAGGIEFPSDPLSPSIALTDRSMFFNERTGELIVRASRDEVQEIKSMIGALINVPPLVEIRARFVEFRPVDLPVPLRSNIQNVTNISVLTEKQFRVALDELENSSHADILTAPFVTAISGRQVRVAVEEVRPWIYQDPPALPRDTSPDADPTPRNKGRMPFPPTFSPTGAIRREPIEK
jgi:hypothetical protein